MHSEPRKIESKIQQDPKVLAESSNKYVWQDHIKTLNENALINRIDAPVGYKRTPTDDNSFEHWLRFLPLKPGQPKVKLYNGSLKSNQSAQYAVIDIDVGNKDLQQCADATMRLRAEYL